MAEQKIPTTKTPIVTVAECQGNLVIRAWMETAVSCKGDDFQVDESETGFSVSSNSDLKLMLPAEAALAVEAVSGDLVVKNITGDISLGEVNGDAVLSGAGHIKINTIGSDFSAKNVDGHISANLIQGDAILRRVGPLNVQAVRGDMAVKVVNGEVTISDGQGDISLRSINGDVTIEHCQRDVNLSNLGGKTAVRDVQGDIRLRGGLSAAEHIFEARRDIIVRWPLDAPIDFTANAARIMNRVILEKEVATENSLTGRLGDGETAVTFTAGDRFILKEGHVINPKWEDEFMEGETFDFDFSNLGEQISAQVNEQIARATAHIETNFGPEFTEKISRKIARKAEKAATRAEKAAARARRRAERQAARATSKGYGRSAKTTPPKKASKEEQIKILKMVEQGIITPEEANTLLDALEK